MTRTRNLATREKVAFAFMGRKQIGKWERDPVSGGMIFFVTYCATCEDKIFVSRFQLQELMDNTSMFIRQITIWGLIKKALKARMPKFRIRFEWGEEGSGIKSEAQLDQHIFNLHHQKYKY